MTDVLHRDKYYAAVGQTCNGWSALERVYAHLASDIMRLPSGRKHHDLLFRHFGFVSLSMFLEDYAAVRLRKRELIEQIRYVTKYVDVCRRNRNVVAHAFVSDIDDRSTAKARLFPDQRRSRKRTVRIKVADLYQLHEDFNTAGILIIRAQLLCSKNPTRRAKKLLGKHWRQALFSKPPLPKLLLVNRSPPRKRKTPSPSQR